MTDVAITSSSELEYWEDSALCAQVDPQIFFPEKGGSTKAAKLVCSRCEVTAQCLEYALEHNERFGIWGGLSERERRRLKGRGGSSRVGSVPVARSTSPRPVRHRAAALRSASATTRRRTRRKPADSYRIVAAELARLGGYVGAEYNAGYFAELLGVSSVAANAILRAMVDVWLIDRELNGRRPVSISLLEAGQQLLGINAVFGEQASA